MNSEQPAKKIKLEMESNSESSNEVAESTEVALDIPMEVGESSLPLASSIELFFERPEEYAPKPDFLLEFIDDETMLTHAIKLQKEAAVRALIKIGADVNEQDKRGVAPLSAAAYKGSLSILNLIIAAGANINAQNHSGSTALIQASHFGNVGAVKLLLANRALADFANAKGTTALMRASQEGHEAVCDLLIKHGADVNRKNFEGMNSLMLASQRGLASMVTYLINSNAFVDDQTSQGSTALMLASKRGHQACVEVLVFRGAEIYMKDLRGRTARDTATKKSYLNLLPILDTQRQIQMIQLDVKQKREALLYSLRDAYENNTLSLDPVEAKAISCIRGIFELMFKNGGGLHESGTIYPLDSSSDTGDGLFQRVKIRPFTSIAREVSSSSPVTSISSTPTPLESDTGLAETSPHTSLHSPVVAELNTLPSVSKSTLSAEYACCNGYSTTCSPESKLKPRRTKTAEWDWPLLLQRSISMPKEIFQLITEYLPLPRVWHWSLGKLRNRSKLAPHPALDDTLRIIDEILCDSNVFNVRDQSVLLVRLNSHPEIAQQLQSVWGMPAELVNALKGLSDIQSLRARTSELEVTFRPPLVKQVLAVVWELFKWHKYRSASQRVAIHAMSSLAANQKYASLPRFDKVGGESPFGIFENLEGPDFAGSDVEAIEQDTENEVPLQEESQQEYDSDSAARRTRTTSGGVRPLQQQLHQPQPMPLYPLSAASQSTQYLLQQQQRLGRHRRSTSDASSASRTSNPGN